MKVPFSWLKEYVEIDCSVYELAEKLLASGFEVEEIVDLNKSIHNIVVGQITAISRHPNADKLQVCKVNCGKHGSDLQIITAATNIAVGNYVPVALHGAVTANNMHIYTTNMRGVDSYGMFCSGEELGIGEEFFTGASVDGILILENALYEELQAFTQPVLGGYNYLFSQIGQPIQPLVGLNDYILDIAITANRPDCQSIYGMAREVAAILNRPLKALNVDYKSVYASIQNRPNVFVKESALSLCPQYLGQVLQNVQCKAAPKWMQRRLALCGMRAKDAAVDITNYILLELGQPLHAFDLAKIKNNIAIRRASHGESVQLLNGKEVVLANENLVIADDEKVLALAGIMGGQSSAVTTTTKNIFLECATFDRANIRRTSKAMAMRTEASARYEKGVDSDTGKLALKRALHLFDSLQVATVVQEFSAITNIEKTGHITGCENLADELHILPASKGGLVGKVGGNMWGDSGAIRMLASTYGYRENVRPAVIQTSYRKINSVLGIKLANAKIKDILERLHFTVEEIAGVRELGNIDYKLVGDHLEHSQILVTAPAYRGDIEGYADLAEEVIRLYGYEHLESRLFTSAKVTQGGLNKKQKLYAAIKRLYVGQNYQESMTLSFISRKEYDLFQIPEQLAASIQIQNPIGEDYSIMRTTLAPSMLQALITNIRKCNREARLFECANVYKKAAVGMPHENMTIAFGVYGDKENFYSLKGAFDSFAKQFGFIFEYRPIAYNYLHHGRSAEVVCNGQVVGYLGELAPAIAEEVAIDVPVYLGELYLHLLEADCNQSNYFTKLAKFNNMYRDISLVVPKEMTCKAIEDVIYATDSSIVLVKLFDTYYDEKLGQNNKSLAFTITFENADRERLPEEIDAIMQDVVENLQQKLHIYRR